MRLRIRIRGNTNYLLPLRQLNIYGKRYKIEKIQKLTENFEKACWRSVRTAEERAYLKKYHFLKYCVNLINNTTDSNTHRNFHNDSDAYKYSQQILRQYNGENMQKCIENIDRIIDQDFVRSNIETHQHDLPSTGESKPTYSTLDLDKLKRIKRKLEDRLELYNRYGMNKDILGYTKNELECMIKL